MGELKLIHANDLPPVAWKNGGGVTREIGRDTGPDGVVWRLSMADVDREGRFSIFPGMSRILTVIEGDGLELHGDGQRHEVACCTPFAFSGETPIRSVLRNGKIRDFNVIFDGTRVDAQVTILDGPMQFDLRPNDDMIYGTFAIAGDYSCNGVRAKKWTTLLIDEEAVSVELPVASKLLLVSLKRL